MEGFLKQRGGYRNLRVYKLTEIVYDLTVYFVRKYIPANSRTRDQMEQAARSGKQNIAEGSMASETSRETEIKLTNVAKASLEELLLDYEDYLRQNGLRQWEEGFPRKEGLVGYIKSEDFMWDPLKFADSYSAEEFCNLCIALIYQASYLLHRLMEAQQRQFLREGGIREQMYNARKNYRDKRGLGRVRICGRRW